MSVHWIARVRSPTSPPIRPHSQIVPQPLFTSGGILHKQYEVRATFHPIWIITYFYETFTSLRLHNRVVPLCNFMLRHDQTIQCYSHRMNWNRYMKLRFTWRKDGLTLESIRAESSPIRHAKTRRRLFRLLIMAQRGNAYTPAVSCRVESSRVESSRVESSTVEYSRVQSDAAETIWLTYYGRAQVRTDTVQPSPVQPDSPRHGISLTL